MSLPPVAHERQAHSLPYTNRSPDYLSLATDILLCKAHMLVRHL